MDLLKLMVLRILMRYSLRCKSLPHSTTMEPFGSVTTKEQGYFSEVHCIKLGLIQKRVLPLPEPPTISTFLLRAFAGFFGDPTS